MRLRTYIESRHVDESIVFDRGLTNVVDRCVTEKIVPQASISRAVVQLATIYFTDDCSTNNYLVVRPGYTKAPASHDLTFFTSALLLC